MNNLDHNLIHAKNLLQEYDAWVRRVESLEKSRSKEAYIELHRKEKDKSFNEIVRLIKKGLDNE